MNGQEEKSGGLCEKQERRSRGGQQLSLSTLQPYRNAAMVLAEARSIHNKDKEEENNRIIASSGEPDTKAFRNNSLLLAEPKTIYKLEDKGQKFVTPSGDPDKSAYRSYQITFSILSILTYIPYRIIQDLPAGAGRGQEYLQPVRHGEQVEGAEWGPGALRLQDLHAAAARGQEHLQFGGHRQ